METHQLAASLLAAFGGAENLVKLRYCASRIRAELHDDGRLDRQSIEGLPGVKALLEVETPQSNTEYQLVVGPGNAKPLYQALVALSGEK
ncbi:PTS system EIIBC component SA0186 [Serratia proteamaculans]|uniref:PTS transporter subunit EIIB n=1 Tax=Serratia proteamaculans TaxID=28151 RepID=UPI0021780A26|nr:PTS transporter subunit EIIB [Serratia proteamaculans]CAI0899788.1 PTS system EIIBC component SA0186 [Serratia proteamaculans]CAI1779233.1 PTS system EIIBC component SA0186 [Serratia proteamaculans]